MRLVYFLRFFLVFSLSGLVWAAPASESEGYVEVPRVGSYKLHQIDMSFAEAAQICESEDAHLAIINSKEEEDVLANLLRGAPPVHNPAFIGVNDIAEEGQMVTVLGEIWSEVGFFTWSDSEPNDHQSAEDCVTFSRNREINDMRCGRRLSFFCEKKTARDTGATGNASKFASFSEGYVSLTGLGSYRVHDVETPYSEAAQHCENEGAHLAIADSKLEDEAMVNLLKGTYASSAYIGINDRALEGHMVTVLGNPLMSNPVSKWAENEPNDYCGEEDCVTIGRDSLLNDLNCGLREFFICEKYPVDNRRDRVLGVSAANGGYVSVLGVGSYMLHEFGLSYSDATQVCETEQAHLAIVNSKAEEDVLMDLLYGSRYLISAYVGVNDVLEEGRWVTALDEVWTRVGYSKWGEGEPKDVDGSKDCVTIGLDRLVAARKCTEQFGYFCEKKRTPGSSLGQKQVSDKVSKPGYDTYLKVTGVGSYKLYRGTKSYSDAAHVCENEGAHLAVVSSKEEEDVLTDLLNNSDRFLAYVGVNDIAIEGQWVTVLGQDWSQVGFTTWREGEPNDLDGAEDCAVFRGDRLIEDGKCGVGHSFFCEKNTATESFIQGATLAALFSAGYITLPGVGSYRLHEELAPYGEAARMCANEGAHLAIINSKVEKDAIFNIFNDSQLSSIYVGVNDLAVEGFMVTALGNPLASAGFPLWANSEPNDDYGIEDCVVLSREGTMNDQKCGLRNGFLCEKKSGSSIRQGVSVAEGGYVSVPGVGSYMLHEFSLSYSAAAHVCETEQAHLAVVNSKAEEDVLMNLLYGSRLRSAYVGVNDIAREGRMVTVLGDLWSRVGYSAWREGEPHDPDGTADCVSIDTSRLLSGQKCSVRLGYFCEKNSGLNPNKGGSTSYIKKGTGSYKLHTETKSYYEAGQLCESEGAHLAVVNSKQEEDAMISLLQMSKRSVAYVGVNDIDVEGKMVTVLGDLLAGTGYFKWARGEPKNRNGLEDCATIQRDRLMRVRECGEYVSFICEKKSGCPGLPHEPSLEMECTHNGAVVNCAAKAEPGTVAAMSCARGFVHKSGKKFFSSTCLTSSHRWSEPLPKCEMDCGRSGSGGQAFATRGTPVELGEMPWHVGIFKRDKGTFDQWCGGTLITPTLVISAAHCFWSETGGQKVDSALFRVAAGQISRSWDSPETLTQQRAVTEIVMPLRFSGKTNNYQSDIALVRLSRRLDITLAVNVACIDWNEVIASLVAGTNGTVAGWGLNEDGVRSPTLTAVQMAYLPYQECWNLFQIKNPNFRKFITADKLCAGWIGRGTTVCPGDSGGGLVFPKETATGTRYFLRGIVSVGPSAMGGARCNADSVAAFTDIAAHSKFLDTNVRH